MNAILSPCHAGGRHNFDGVSGYCVRCGRQRIDGRYVDRYGSVVYEPDALPDETQLRAEAIMAARSPGQVRRP